MKPGPARILKCPFCGQNKKIMSLRSGNTFGAEVWSDAKQIARMLPEVSFVQKCPACQYYYLTNKQEVVYDETGKWSSEQGLLSFSELCDALERMENTIDNKDEARIRIMLLHAYNDLYYRGKAVEPAVEDERFMYSNMERLLEIIDWNSNEKMLKAELYREMSKFDECIQTLADISYQQRFMEESRLKIIEKAFQKDNIVFLLTPPICKVESELPLSLNDNMSPNQKGVVSLIKRLWEKLFSNS